ncbi:MAG TPA: hypothetical protein VNJ08_06655 [Bacteriovoracaceae bacterium]|nr:hypothetical protein [Bacteriovoracaceae bacterium]
MHFIRIFFLTSALITALLLGFIYSIDPYDKYGINVFRFETKAVAMARENKFNMVDHAKKNYEAFVIGSSAAHRLHTDDVEALTGFKTFNYAVQHTTPEDYLAITRHILARAKPKLILFQMDLYGLNENFKTDTRFYTSPLKAYLDNKNQGKPENSWFDSDYFTIGAINDSFKVIWVNVTGTVKHLYLDDGNYQKEKPYTGPLLVTQYSYENYKLSDKRIQLLTEMKRLCDEKSVRLLVWTAPYSLEHIQRIMSDEKVSHALKEFKDVLVEIFGEIYDFTNTDVAKFNSVTYFRDSSHPERELFKVILNQVLNNSDSTDQFGKKLKP